MHDDTTNELLICTSCLMLVANDDTTALDDDEATALRQAVSDRWAGWDIVPGDEMGFSWSGCDCCGSNLGGDKSEANAYPKPREIAALWHGGQSSPLYAYCSSGTVVEGLRDEIRADLAEATNATAERDLTALLDSLPPAYIVGTNTPGFMPDSEPSEADTLEQAKRILIADMLFDADYADSEDVAEELTHTAEDVNLWSGADSVTVAGRAYWVEVAS